MWRNPRDNFKRCRFLLRVKSGQAPMPEASKKPMHHDPAKKEAR